MRYLCFSDLHCDKDAARKLVTRSQDADVVLGAGDFSIKHNGLADTLDILAEIDKPSILVPGNGETVEALREAAFVWKSAVVLHGEGTEIGGETFWGVGGGIPVTPFGAWSYDFDEDQAQALLAGCPENGVLVVHSPPFEPSIMTPTERYEGANPSCSVFRSNGPNWSCAVTSIATGKSKFVSGRV